MADTYIAEGRILDEKRKPIKNLYVEAFDDDVGLGPFSSAFGNTLSPNDYLGNAFTNKNGVFRIKFKTASFKGKYEVFEGQPDVYLVISDEYGVIKTTAVNSRPKNNRFEFKVTIKDEGPFFDPYANSAQRLLTQFTATGQSADPALINPIWTGPLLIRSITSYLHYSDPRVAQLYGNPGPQVAARPKDSPDHEHIIPWRKTK
jgi:hypothetical protein